MCREFQEGGRGGHWFSEHKCNGVDSSVQSQAEVLLNMYHWLIIYCLCVYLQSEGSPHGTSRASTKARESTQTLVSMCFAVSD